MTGLYDRLDQLRERASARLAGVLRQAGGTPAAQTEREALTVMYRQQLAQLDAAENGLCFGRLEFNDGVRTYIGRLGMHADNESYDQILMDWRADAARPFYLATAASPGEVRVRRHIKTRARTVLRLDDEVLDLSIADPNRHEGMTGESALLAALNVSRTGRMRDIVETIQVEQDAIIRAGLQGVLVVQGGPGTGKTAVALHRAAYLLYTYRRQLEKRGVLVVGPNATFLRYIGQVLPSLGETSVLLATVGDLMPAITATGAEPAEVARIKGRPGMAQIVASAVRDRQRVPHEGLEISFEKSRYRLGRQSLSRARERARRSRRPHNLARQIFVREVFDELARVVAGRLGADPLGGANLLGRADIADLRDELRDDPQVRAAIGRLWPVLTPQQLIGDLFASRRLLAAAAPSLPASERELLRRPAGSPWTPADIPLLDEAAELLGEDDRAAKAAAGRAGGGVRGGRAGDHRPGRGRRPRDPDGRRHARRGRAGRAVRQRRLPDTRRAGRGRPDVGVRAHDRRRGAGTLADGVAGTDAPLPVEVDDDRRGRRADRRRLRIRLVVRGARAVCRGPVAAGPADRELPHAGRNHDGGRRCAGPDRSRGRAAPLGQGLGGGAVAARRRGPRGVRRGCR